MTVALNAIPLKHILRLNVINVYIIQIYVLNEFDKIQIF